MTEARTSDDPDHTGVWVRAERELAGMTRTQVVERLRTDPLHPLPEATEEWLAAIESGVGVTDLTYAQITALSRATVPPRPDWWEEGYEHDLGFSREGHAPPRTEGYRRYWARVATVHEEVQRYRSGGADPQEHLRVLCELLAAYGVAYLLIGGGAAIGHGAQLVTEDTDVVPRTDAENLERLCDALNILGPRWYDDAHPEGRRIDGRRLEPRHFAADSAALALWTRLGRVDVVLRPRGFEDGYPALAPRMVRRVSDGVELRLASLDDVIASKELLDRPKDREQLPELRRLRDQQRG